MVGRRLIDIISKNKTTAITTIFGLIAGPIIGYYIIDYITITPSDLVQSLENGDVGKFNDERKQIKEQIVLDRIDLSGKDLQGANLNSLVIQHSNLSKTNLQNSKLEDAQISGDLSYIDLSNANLLN